MNTCHSNLYYSCISWAQMEMPFIYPLATLRSSLNPVSHFSHPGRCQLLLLLLLLSQHVCHVFFFYNQHLNLALNLSSFLNQYNLYVAALVLFFCLQPVQNNSAKFIVLIFKTLLQYLASFLHQHQASSPFNLKLFKAFSFFASIIYSGFSSFSQPNSDYHFFPLCSRFALVFSPQKAGTVGTHN